MNNLRSIPLLLREMVYVQFIGNTRVCKKLASILFGNEKIWNSWNLIIHFFDTNQKLPFYSYDLTIYFVEDGFQPAKEKRNENSIYLFNIENDIHWKQSFENLDHVWDINNFSYFDFFMNWIIDTYSKLISSQKFKCKNFTRMMMDVHYPCFSFAYLDWKSLILPQMNLFIQNLKSCAIENVNLFLIHEKKQKKWTSLIPFSYSQLIPAPFPIINEKMVDDLINQIIFQLKEWIMFFSFQLENVFYQQIPSACVENVCSIWLKTKYQSINNTSEYPIFDGPFSSTIEKKDEHNGYSTWINYDFEKTLFYTVLKIEKTEFCFHQIYAQLYFFLFIHSFRFMEHPHILSLCHYLEKPEFCLIYNQQTMPIKKECFCPKKHIPQMMQALEYIHIQGYVFNRLNISIFRVDWENNIFVVPYPLISTSFTNGIYYFIFYII